MSDLCRITRLQGIGVSLFLGKTDHTICPIKEILPYLAIRGHKLGPLFLAKDNKPLTRQKFHSTLAVVLQQVGLQLDSKIYNTRSFEFSAGLEQQHQHGRLAYLMHKSRCWGDGRPVPISSISVLEITVGHWPFSNQFQHLADQNPFWSAKFTIHFQWDGN